MKKMLRNQLDRTKIPDLWKMSAMFCPKEIQDMVELRWGEIGEIGKAGC